MAASLTPSNAERRNLVGAILAAGRGSRMETFGERYPKPILPICNKPLIVYQIELMRSMGIHDIVVLLGHRGFEIAKILGDGAQLGVNVRYVEQTQRLGLAHAVGRLEPVIDRPFVLFLGDIFFIPRDLGEIVTRFEEQQGGAVLVTKEERDPAAIRRNFSVTLSEDGTVTRVVEKPRYTTNSLKGVGVYLFDLTIFDAIRRTPRTAMRNEYEITEAIQVMIDDGYPVRVANAIQDDVNLTTPADLLSVNLQQARSLPASTLIGKDCQLHEGVSIEESVIGAGVIVRRPIAIRRSVVFERTQLDSSDDIEDSIVTPDVIVECGRSSPTRGEETPPAR
jgi:glucose-1-phosphate thymidylyltransferase